MFNSFPAALMNRKVFVARDCTAGQEGFEGIVTETQGEWVYVDLQIPGHHTHGIWVNTNLQREISILF